MKAKFFRASRLDRVSAMQIFHSGRQAGLSRMFTFLFLALFSFASIGANAGSLFINEILFNPPGSPDHPNEYIELRGVPNDAIANDTYLVSIDGDGSNVGKIRNIFPLGGLILGTNGFLVLLQKSHVYAANSGATVITNSGSQSGWGDGSGSSLGHQGDGGRTNLVDASVTFMLIQTSTAPGKGQNIDSNKDGVMDGMATNWVILDAVGVLDADGSPDTVYGKINFRRNTSPGNTALAGGTIVPVGFTANYVGRNGHSTGWNATNWVASDTLSGSAPNYTLHATATYPAGRAGASLNHIGSSNFGEPYNFSPTLSVADAMSGMIGDPNNPTVNVIVSDVETAASALTVSAISLNTTALPQNRISLTGTGGTRVLTITPTNVCYAVPVKISVGDGTNVTEKILVYSASSGWSTNAMFHIMMCDASTSLALDSNYMLVGDDETHPIRLYDRTRSGLPLAAFDFSQELGLSGFAETEIDLEASTRTGNRIYWLGSLGNTTDGLLAPSRNRLFATQLSGSGTNITLTYVGRYDHLREDIIAWDALGLHGKGQHYYDLQSSSAFLRPPKAADGFAVEGLTMVLGGTTNMAYIGFRGPLVPLGDRRKALLLPVLNLSQLVSSNPASGPALFGQPVELDLGGRGIRSMEAYGGGYLIVAGPAGGTTGDPLEFRLFTWSGNPFEAPVLHSARLEGMIPEGIAGVSDGPLGPSTMVQLISDNGFTKWYLPASDVDAKDLPYDNLKKFRSDWVLLGDPVPLHHLARPSETARVGRFIRGTGTNAAFHSFVTPLDLQTGVALDAVAGNATNLFPNNDWTNSLSHYNAISPGSPITFRNPVAAFGAMGGGSALHPERPYRFKVGFGDRARVPSETNQPALRIWVYERATMFKAGEMNIHLPLPGTAADSEFIRTGLTVEIAQWGLKTTVYPDADQTATPFSVYVNHHSQKTDYVFVVLGQGFRGQTNANGTARATLVTKTGVAHGSPLYVLNFDFLPPWRSAFLAQPHFEGEPLPPAYAGKTPEELLSYSQPVTNTVSLGSPSSYTNLNHSPELWRHPILDEFVTAMGNDPIALANYVFNEIELTDAMSYSDSGASSTPSLHLGGLNRGALGVFLEGQGSPMEQCSLLVYLLRRAGVSAVYLYPPENGIKLLDQRLSQLLRIQLKGAVNNQGTTSVPSLIPVNYPWVAAYIGTNWVHLFPWLKDTEIIEGLNLYEFMPKGYQSGHDWALGYLMLRPGISDLAYQEESPTQLFPRFISSTLNENYPGISIDDLGVRVRNRRHHYARWQDFPTPTSVTNVSTAVESLGVITSSFPSKTNEFDTVNIEVYSITNTGKKIMTGDLRTSDLHNRQLLLWYQETSGNHLMHLTLASYRPDTTNAIAWGAFNPQSPTDTNILRRVTSSVLLNSTDDTMVLKITHKRHRALPASYGTNSPAHYDSFLGFSRIQPFSLVHEMTQERRLRKGDLAAICLNMGRVSPAMIEVHSQSFWPVQELARTNAAAAQALGPEKYQGALCHLFGLSYFAKVDGFREMNQQAHKANTISWYAAGAAQLGAKRNSSGVLLSGALEWTKPRLDIFFQQIAFAGNGTLHADSEYDMRRAASDFYEIQMVTAAAEEHAVLNAFFGQTNAISSARLLQFSQLQGLGSQAGILQLNATNYLSYGETQYGLAGNQKKLKEFDPETWKTITNVFSSPALSNLARVYITPGLITNDVGSHLGALVFAGNYFAALLSPGLNGGESLSSAGIQFFQPGGVVLYLGNDGKYHPIEWFGHKLYGGNKFMVTSGRSGEFGLPSQITVPAGMVSLARKLTPEQLFALMKDLGLIKEETYKDYYSYPSSLSGSQIFNLVKDKGDVGNPWWVDRLRMVLDPVDVLTGDFYVESTDLTLAGPWPLTLSRNYTSGNRAKSEIGYGWKLNVTPYLVVTPDESRIYATEMNGSVVAYRQQTSHLWTPVVADNPQLPNPNQPGQPVSRNLLLAKIERTQSGGVTNFTLSGPDGSRRAFRVQSFPEGGVSRERPYLERWEDSRGNFYQFSFGSDATRTDYGKLRRMESSNGGFIVLSYDSLGQMIEAYTHDGRRVRYGYSEWGDLVQVELPDGAETRYDYLFVPLPGSLVTNVLEGWVATNPDGPTDLVRGIVGTNVFTNLVSSHLILREHKPDGRLLINFYDHQNRVTNQWATAGLDLRPVHNATFVYANNHNVTNSFTNGIKGSTFVIDAFGHTNRYDYTNSVITKITDPLGHAISSEWYWSGAEGAGSYARSLKSRTDKRGLRSTLSYDTQGNVLTNRVSGPDLTGDGQTNAVIRFAYTNLNRLSLQVDPMGRQTRFVYGDGSQPYLPTGIGHFASNGTFLVTNVVIYTNVAFVITDGSIVRTNKAFGLMMRQIRAAQSTDAVTNDWLYDGRGFVTTEIRYTGTADPNVTNTFVYNARGELVERIGQTGRKARFHYDPMGRPTGREVFEDGQNAPLFWEYSYYNENGELTWSDGPRFDPEDYVWRDYDGAGRKTTEVRWRSRAREDGTGVEAPLGDDLYATSFFDYDPFGNLILATNPRGTRAAMEYDALGQLIREVVYDAAGLPMSTNRYGYEAGGQITRATNALGAVTEMLYTTAGQPKYRKNADGSTNAWRYHLDGRLKKEVLRNGSYWTNIYNDVSRRITNIFYSATHVALATNVTELDRRGNVILRIDEGGFGFTNKFDGLDRIKWQAGPVIDYDLGTNGPPNIGGPPPKIQQAVTNFYDAAGLVMTNLNAVGEKTITWMDALGRPTRTEIRAANNTLVRESSAFYAAGHHSVTNVQGGGSGAVTTSEFTDNFGNPVLSLSYPASGVRHFARREFDAMGNLELEAQYSVTNGNRIGWAAMGFAYDGMNRVKLKLDRDEALTSFWYDPAGNLITRVNPGGLEWWAEYNPAGQMLKSYNWSGSAGTRTNAYSYYAGSHQWAGLLQTHTDGRGVAVTTTYDAFLRPAAASYTGSSDEYKLTTVWQYDARSFATNITETFQSGATGPSTRLRRDYDPYGLLTHEHIYVGSELVSRAYQTWHSSGRREGVRLEGRWRGFGWRADGLLASVDLKEVNSGYAAGTYAYDNAGNLLSRTAMPLNAAGGTLLMEVTSRDGSGRMLGRNTKVNGTTRLTETLAWTGDGLLSAHTLARSDFTDSRSYEYAHLSRRLAAERLKINASKSWTNVFEYDAGAAGKDGVLTKIAEPNTGGSSWTASMDLFSRVERETNNVVRRLAHGKLNSFPNFATAQVSLDGRPQPVTFLQTADPQWPTQWRSTLEIRPGPHTLVALAKHPYGYYETNKSVTFTNNAIDQTTLSYFAEGQMNLRIWKNSLGQTNRVQTFTWDGKGRLLKMSEIDASTNGYNWSAVYDPLGRKIRTTTVVVTNGVALTSQPKTIKSFFDPEHKFLELGVNVDGKTTWKLIGPDANGRYGGLHGIGGLDGVIDDIGIFHPVVSDARGNLLASYDPVTQQMKWTESRPTGYGAIPEHRPVALVNNADVVQASAWLNRWPEITGIYWMGERIYDPQGGYFLSHDPVFDPANPNGYSYAGGDPINFVDPDGKLAAQTFRSASGQVASFQDSFFNGGVTMVQWSHYGAGHLLDMPHLVNQGEMLEVFMSPMQQLGLYTPGSFDAHIGESAALVSGTYALVRQVPSVMSRVANWWESLWTKPAAPTSMPPGVRPYEVDTYGNLQQRSLVRDGLALDHQPSHASNVARAQAELGRRLSPDEIEQIRRQGTAVAVPEQWHRTQSPTFGGRNTPAKIETDAANPAAAAARDSAAMVNGSTAAQRAAAERAAALVRRQAGEN
jgi:RHS repeat-associated protein